jgi:ABC-type nitrate/sulfonate/bicarbonate transport system substrate-binding protein
MDFISQNIIGMSSRRTALKLGTAAAFTALAPNILRAQSARPKVNLLTVSGNFPRVQQILLDELKLFEKYNVDGNILAVSDSSKILVALVSGDGDICPGSGYNQLFPAMEKGATVKLTAGAALAPLNIMYSSKPDIKSVKDLEGRTVGTDSIGSLLNQLATAVMKKYGVDYKKVNFVNIGGSGDIFKALVAGKIDAGVAPIDYRDNAAKYNLTPLIDGEFWKELPLYANQAMYASDKAIAERREGLIRVMAVYGDMFRWIANPANRTDFLRFYKQAIPTASDTDATFLLDFLSKPGALATNLILSEEQLRFVQDLNVEFEQQKAVLPFNRCADMSLAQEAVKLIKS